MANPPRTRVEMAAVRAVGQGEEALVAMHLQSAFDFHRTITDNAGSHLALLEENTYRTTWMATKLLSKDPRVARAAAEDLARHLAAMKTGNMSPFRATSV